MPQDSGIVGIDVGDKHCQVCTIDPDSGVVFENLRIPTKRASIIRHFKTSPMRITLETGPHSPWISRLLNDLGHEVIVANARAVRLIHGGPRKSDQLDAEKLARLARYDVKLLAPVEHRSEQSQADLACIRSRASLVQARTALINHVRGSVKAFGTRLPKCGAAVFAQRALERLPELLRPALEGVLKVIGELTREIKASDKRIEQLATEAYPATALLKRVGGVGSKTALTFVLTLEEPERFRKSREVGPYLGLTPGQWQSGDRDVRRRITKQGDGDLRWLLVQCANIILGPKVGDCDLKRFGERLLARGGPYARSKAVVAVARKLAVLLHRLWVTGEVYDPFFNSRRTQASAVGV